MKDTDSKKLAESEWWSHASVPANLSVDFLVSGTLIISALKLYHYYVLSSCDIFLCQIYDVPV